MAFELGKRCGAILTIALALIFGAQAAVAQPAERPLPPSGSSPAMQAAGIIPSSISLLVTGVPADGSFLETQIRGALDRQIRPTLRPGAWIRYGSIVPWPILPLAPGDRAAVNVAVTIAGNDNNVWVNGVTTVNVYNIAVARAAPTVLFLSDDPEYLQAEGLAFRGKVDAGGRARLYYYHSDIGVPRDLDVVLTAAVPSRLHVIQSGSGPDLDVMSVGHTVSRNFLLFQQQNEGTVVDVVPGSPLILRHDLLLQGELVAGVIDLHVLAGGPISVSVVASPAGSRADAYLNGPHLAYDGHNRHGVFDLDGYGVITAVHTIGGPDVAVRYGGAKPTLHNLDPADPGRDHGDYGVVQRITFKLINPTDVARPVYLYEKPLGGPVRSSFLIDGQLKEVGCARLPQPYWFMTYLVPPHATGESTTITMTDGGSFYPIEFGATEALPVPITPPLNAADGCTPNVTPWPAPRATTAAATRASPAPTSVPRQPGSAPTAAVTTAPAPIAAPGATPPPQP
jgi:hypothetical protein